MGYSRPLIGELNDGELIHGETGFDGPQLPEKAFEKSELNSVELMIKTIEEAEEKITIVALGPLSNVARFIYHQAGPEGEESSRFP